MEPWQIYYRMAQRLGLQLKYPSISDLLGIAAKEAEFKSEAPMLDMAHEPSTDELYEMMCTGSAVPLSKIKEYPNGHLFDEARKTVLPRDEDCIARLELGNETMLSELRQVRAETHVEQGKKNPQFPFLFIPRRIQNSTNVVSSTDRTVLKRTYNPAYMNPADLDRLGLASGDKVEIRSQHGSIIGFVEAESDLRPGVLSMTHGFGKNPGDDYDPKRDGANVNRLTSWTDDYDGMPRMGAIPVAVTAISDPH